MNVLEKMLTALRGGATEAGEAIVDSQALRILDQEIRDAYEELKQTKDSLAEIMARQKLSEEKCVKHKERITEHEGYALAALEKDDESLALEVSEKIAEMENQLKMEEEAGAGFAESADNLRTAIKQTERNLSQLKQQVDTVKATENVQKAQAAVAERHSGSQSKMRTAMDSLDRIKEKQALKAAQISSAAELAEESTDVSLQAKLEDAGIAPAAKNAADVLQRLKEKSKG